MSSSSLQAAGTLSSVGEAQKLRGRRSLKQVVPYHTWEKRERVAKRALFLLESSGCRSPQPAGLRLTFQAASPTPGRPPGIKDTLRRLAPSEGDPEGPFPSCQAPLFLTRNDPPRRRKLAGISLSKCQPFRSERRN